MHKVTASIKLRVHQTTTNSLKNAQDYNTSH